MVLMSLMLSVVVTVVPVHVYKELNIIKSAGVEFRGLKTSAISRCKLFRKPVLEKYVLTPNVEPAHLDLHTALRVCTHITLENKPVTQVKVVECHTQSSTLLAPAVALILAGLPLSKASITMWNAGSHNYCHQVITASFIVSTEIFKEWKLTWKVRTYNKRDI
jgi:ribulose-5-phosphate 4-epimerase/fuculose-1-phosphate aldolase